MAIQDFIDRIRVRQGDSGTAGMWLFQAGPKADRAFVGMLDDNKVGLWGNTGAGWGFHMDTTTGKVTIGSSPTNYASRLQVEADFDDGSGVVVQNNRDNVSTIVARNHSGGPAGSFTGSISVYDNSPSWSIYAGNNGSGDAGWFNGDVRITGRLTNSLSQFKIDHPLDPDNQYLSHSVMESDEMKNVYDGEVVLDANGEAEIQLGSWCEAFNHRFRYQLTPIGSPAPDLHVAQELAANRFRIAGGRPGMTVCWQVTGVRQDAYAQTYPLLVEEDKLADERGYYLHPELYGQPAERSIEWARNPEQMRLISERTRGARAQSGGEGQADAQLVGRK